MLMSFQISEKKLSNIDLERPRIGQDSIVNMFPNTFQSIRDLINCEWRFVIEWIFGFFFCKANHHLCNVMGEKNKKGQI